MNPTESVKLIRSNTSLTQYCVLNILIKVKDRVPEGMAGGYLKNDQLRSAMQEVYGYEMLSCNTTQLMKTLLRDGLVVSTKLTMFKKVNNIKVAHTYVCYRITRSGRKVRDNFRKFLKFIV